jgi:hypothetical protein
MGTTDGSVPGIWPVSFVFYMNADNAHPFAGLADINGD